MSSDVLFSLAGKVAIITGGAGLLGREHGAAIARAGGAPVLVDIRGADAEDAAAEIGGKWGVESAGCAADITNPDSIRQAVARIMDRFGRIDILVNNAARNPKVEAPGEVEFSRLENFPLSQWHEDLGVGLTGAFLCSQLVGTEMARRGSGVIVNIASDLALISPDQRIYREVGRPDDRQPVKPVTYSVVKAALLGLTRYLATYWAGSGVRVNALSPGGVRTDQPVDFVARLSNLIPLARMASRGEYQGALIFLCSDASSYMTGANLVIDGGRTAW